MIYAHVHIYTINEQSLSLPLFQTSKMLLSSSSFLSLCSTFSLPNQSPPISPFTAPGSYYTPRNIHTPYNTYISTCVPLSVCSLNSVMLHGMTTPTPKVTDDLPNIIAPAWETSLWVGSKRLPEHYRWVHCPCCLPKLDKTLLLKTSHSLNIGLGVIDLELTWKPPPWGLMIMVLENVVQPAREKSHQD